MSLLKEKLLREMLSCDGVIIRHKGMDTWPIRPRGDRRKRPVAWIMASDAMSLLRDEVLQYTPKGLGLSAQTKRRLRFGQAAREVETRTEYAPHGGLRPVRRSVRGTVVDRLARRRGRDGQPLLTDRQIEAMRQFTDDWKRAEGSPSRSDTSQASVDVSASPDQAERQVIARIDAGKKLRAAQYALGPDLSRLMGRLCGADERLGDIERAERWARGSGLTFLRICLDRLSVHYGTSPGVPSRKAG